MPTATMTSAFAPATTRSGQGCKKCISSGSLCWMHTVKNSGSSSVKRRQKLKRNLKASVRDDFGSKRLKVCTNDQLLSDTIKLASDVEVPVESVSAGVKTNTAELENEILALKQHMLQLQQQLKKAQTSLDEKTVQMKAIRMEEQKVPHVLAGRKATLNHSSESLGASGLSADCSSPTAIGSSEAFGASDFIAECSNTTAKVSSESLDASDSSSANNNNNNNNKTNESSSKGFGQWNYPINSGVSSAFNGNIVKTNSINNNNNNNNNNNSNTSSSSRGFGRWNNPPKWNSNSDNNNNNNKENRCNNDNTNASTSNNTNTNNCSSSGGAAGVSGIAQSILMQKQDQCHTNGLSKKIALNATVTSTNINTSNNTNPKYQSYKGIILVLLNISIIV